MLVRPSYVLGGRAMVIAYDEEMVRQYMREAVTFSQDRPVLIDRFLEDATEVDVDALGDGDDVLIAGIMEHIEEAGVHSGDSSCVLPPQSLSDETLRTIEDYTVRLAKALHVIGLMNVQYAIQNGVVYVLEVNPRASRTVPYVSKATGVALPKIAVGLMWGRKLKDYGFGSGKLSVPQVFVKSPVFPFNKFHGVDPVLGPEMRSTGEVMGVGINFGEAFLKAQISRRQSAARKGHGLHQRQRSPQGGSRRGGEALRRTRLHAGRHARHRRRAAQRRPHLQDRVQGERRPAQRGRSAQGRQHPTRHLHHHRRLRLLRRKVHPPQRRHLSRPCITTMSGARAAAEAVAARLRDPIRVWSLQEIHEKKTSHNRRHKKRTRRMFHRRAASFQFDPVLVTSWSPSHRGQGRYQYIIESSPF